MPFLISPLRLWNQKMLWKTSFEGEKQRRKQKQPPKENSSKMVTGKQQTKKKRREKGRKQWTWNSLETVICAFEEKETNN